MYYSPERKIEIANTYVEGIGNYQLTYAPDSHTTVMAKKGRAYATAFGESADYEIRMTFTPRGVSKEISLKLNNDCAINLAPAKEVKGYQQVIHASYYHGRGTTEARLGLRDDGHYEVIEAQQCETDLVKGGADWATTHKGGDDATYDAQRIIKTLEACSPETKAYVQSLANDKKSFFTQRDDEAIRGVVSKVSNDLSERIADADPVKQRNKPSVEELVNYAAVLACACDALPESKKMMNQR